MANWYVFDMYDCFGDCETAAAAAAQAAELVDQGYEGIHIAYLTTAEFDAYIKTGKFPFSK